MKSIFFISPVLTKPAETFLLELIDTTIFKKLGWINTEFQYPSLSTGYLIERTQTSVGNLTVSLQFSPFVLARLLYRKAQV